MLQRVYKAVKEKIGVQGDRNIAVPHHLLAVGFNVNNDRAVRFRKWSDQIVKDYTIQGWSMDKERLKKGHMFTDEYFERQLQNIRQIPMSMEDWAKRLDGFLEFNRNEILTDPGKISVEQAKLHAETEFEKYGIVQDRLFLSDYDKFLLELEKNSNRETRTAAVE